MESKLKPVTKIIDGRSVEVTPFPARQALLFKFRLLRLLGGPLVDLLRGPVAGLLKNAGTVRSLMSGGKIDDTNVQGFDLNFDSLTPDMFNTLDPELSTQLIFEMCACTRVDGHEMTESYINMNFATDLTALYRIFFQVLEVNYKDFLGLLGTTATTVVPATTKTEK